MKKQISFSSFNLYNLQRPGEPMYLGNQYTQEEYDAKIEWTAGRLSKMDADIIGFQELWNGRCLEEAFQLAGLSADYSLFTEPGADRRISVALAVRSDLDVGQPVWIKDFPEELVLRKRGNNGSDDHESDYEVSVEIDRFSRSLLQLEVSQNPPAYPSGLPAIQFFVAHLKSKMPMDLDSEERSNDSIRKHRTALGSALSTIRRTAEAAALRIVLNKIMYETDTPVVLLGDLNDSQLSVTTAIITEQPRYNVYLSSRTGQRSDRGLYSASTLQEYRSLRDVYYTYIHDEQRESLDHILVSEQFYDHSRKRIWSFREMRVWNDHLDEGRKGSPASDHGIILASFDYNPYE